ncbi:hypothetical protein [Roseibium album]|uniref:hypothetical protein n=1 Tax=Roseibium album TaxID=311410 RepID=UPI003BB181F7
MIEKTEPTFWAEIAIAGDYDDARRTCRKFCESGLCVTVTKTSFIYTGGEQSGVLVRLINYPRFPATPAEIEAKAIELAHDLRDHLFQDSFTVITPEKSTWFTRREAV